MKTVRNRTSAVGTENCGGGTGDPNHSAYFFNMHLYKTAFTYFDMGFGATQAWLIFIVALALTLALFGTARRWVYYASGE